MPFATRRIQDEKSDDRKPTVLFVFSPVDEFEPEQWQRVQSRFNILKYDCKSVSEFITHLYPGGKYSNIDAIVRTGWPKCGPHAGHLLFRGEPLQHFPQSLKLICCSGHGYDAADVDALSQMGIWYCNTPDTASDAVANTALHLILNTFRYYTFGEHCARNKQWDRSRELGFRGIDPSNHILGIIGMGSIGRVIAKRAAAGLGMKIHYYNRRPLPEDKVKDISGGVTYHADLRSLLKVADCVCLACPYTKESHHLLSTAQFSESKGGGTRIVNIGRGGLIDEDALLKALEEGKVIGVGLDVHANEPGVNPQLEDNYNVTLLPHIGPCSRTSWKNFNRVNLENLEEFFYGSGLPNTPVRDLSKH